MMLYAPAGIAASPGYSAYLLNEAVKEVQPKPDLFFAYFNIVSFAE